MVFEDPHYKSLEELTAMTQNEMVGELVTPGRDNAANIPELTKALEVVGGRPLYALGKILSLVSDHTRLTTTIETRGILHAAHQSRFTRISGEEIRRALYYNGDDTARLLAEFRASLEVEPIPPCPVLDQNGMKRFVAEILRGKVQHAGSISGWTWAGHLHDINRQEASEVLRLGAEAARPFLLKLFPSRPRRS